MRNNEKESERQKIFVGIDVHLKSWDVTVLSDAGYRKSFNQPAGADALASFLHRTFPKGEYHAVYESGFTGFSTFYALTALGIDTIVVNAADVPTTQKEEVMKNDRRDSMKLAQGLKSGAFGRGIHVRPVEDLDDRSVVRIRQKFKQEESVTKTRIKHLLYSNGVLIPEEFSRSWSRRFQTWLRQEVSLLGPTKKSLTLLLDHLEVLHHQVLAAGRAVRNLIRSEKYAVPLKRLMTVPGIGINFAIVLLTEIGDFSRFPNERAFACALGLVPMCRDSGDKTASGPMSFRGNHTVSSMLMESAWKMAQNDPAMNSYYFHCCRNMTGHKAIVKVARKMSNIIFSMMKKQTGYEPRVMA